MGTLYIVTAARPVENECGAFHRPLNIPEYTYIAMKKERFIFNSLQAFFIYSKTYYRLTTLAFIQVANENNTHTYLNLKLNCF